ncbi:MAG: hypothetical protein M3P82_04410 [Bacteroidota bacterium]|nr:hypothetical protein [Bacteroidota bacterium]
MQDSVVFVFVILTGIKISCLSRKVTDLDNFDESIYLLRGTTLDPFLKPHIDGFIYYLWYKFLYLFTGNNIDLYFLNNSILLILPGLLLFIFLRVINISLLISFLAASIFIISSVNVFVIPFITKFALCVILAGLIIIYKTKTPQKKLLYSLYLSVILIYIRPEFFLSLLITTIIYIRFLLRHANFRDKTLLIKNLSPVVLILFLIIFFNPVSRQRANVAFTQHYHRHIIESERTLNMEFPPSPVEIMKRDFSTEASIFAALMNNPVLFIKHIGFNIIKLTENIKNTFPYFFILSKRESIMTAMYLISILIFLFSFYFFAMRLWSRQSGLFSSIYFLVALPPFLSILIYYPRVHYIIIVFAMILIYVSYEISQRLCNYEIFKKYSFPAAVVFGIFFAAVVPFRANTESIHEISCTQLNTAGHLNSIKFRLKDNLNFFSAGPGIFTYLETNWHHVSDELLKMPLDTFLTKNNVHLILIDNYFLNHPLIKNNTEAETILNDTSFIRINMPDCFSYVLARKDVFR